MEPSRNSTDVTKPPTRARTWTSWTASNRPVNSSQSVTVRFTGWATVTGGGAAAAGAGGLSPQPARVTASSKASGFALKKALRLSLELPLGLQTVRKSKIAPRAKHFGVAVA